MSGVLPSRLRWFKFEFLLIKNSTILILPAQADMVKAVLMCSSVSLIIFGFLQYIFLTASKSPRSTASVKPVEKVKQKNEKSNAIPRAENIKKNTNFFLFVHTTNVKYNVKTQNHKCTIKFYERFEETINFSKRHK